jgi:hypothetical protein
MFYFFFLDYGMIHKGQDFFEEFSLCELLWLLLTLGIYRRYTTLIRLCMYLNP